MFQSSTWSPQRSAWLRTAAPQPATSTLDRPTTTEVLIIGAGYAGLNAALRLLERSIDVAVVDAHEPGFGGSGRNGGQVIAGLKHDPGELLSIFGESRGQHLVKFAGKAADATFEIIKSYGLRCDAEQCGWLQPATDEKTLALVTRRAHAWSEIAGTTPRLVDRVEIERLTGSAFYCGGWIDPRGGQLQPLSYARELARVVGDGGGRVYSRSRAGRPRGRNGRWETEVNGHVVQSKAVLLCANGYASDVVDGLDRSLIPASSVMASTKPLPKTLRSQVMPSKLPISDARRIMNYIRFDPSGRLLIGARGSFGLHEPPGDFAQLRQAAERLFPQIEGVEWEDAWGGLFCLTADFLPHLHRPAPGLYAVAGCNGRGVALMSQLGRLLGDLVGRDGDVETPLALTDIRPIPLHAARRLGLETVLIWYRILDRLHV
ncbi:NAD(P)/FAD-dependent oxidoreductase [Hoeflea poritis]|uniref:FAD-binding oxidoreductase n=1 Tax=Hoeflea poritis TaxID=2993659 RepID=A0ABT4VT51_9HYPH|nr:FAD-binding oxidoreductase [Hoeflea poritis]MDA4847856.1 FAD-binding oxidoreductase [Hoeflea poritis]